MTVASCRREEFCELINPKDSTLFLGEPAPTPYDLQFSCFGYPVRISVWFWLTGLLFGSSMIANESVEFFENGQKTVIPIPPWQAYLLWTGAILASILIHELGHCLAFKKHGLSSRIVLYHFGGLAIPGAWSGHRSTNRSPWSQVEISAAGPVLQIFSALLIAFVFGFFNYRTPLPAGFAGNIAHNMLDNFGLADGKHIATISPGLYLFVWYYMLVSIMWGIFNLLPIYPLDGGQITRNVAIGFFGSETVRYTLMLSIGVAAYIAFSFYKGSPFMAFMFASFAYSNYQQLQSSRGSYRPW